MLGFVWDVCNWTYHWGPVDGGVEVGGGAVKGGKPLEARPDAFQALAVRDHLLIVHCVRAVTRERKQAGDSGRGER